MFNIEWIILIITIYIFIYHLSIFLFAKAYKVNVEKFYVWFDLGFRLFKFRLNNTEFGLGWLPLGGYIKLSGVYLGEDETPKTGDFILKPLAQKLLIQLSGPTLDLIVGLGICAVYLPIPTTAIFYCFLYVLAAFIAFFLVYKAVSLFFKPNNGVSTSSNNTLLIYFILLITYSTLLYVAAVNVNRTLPFIEETIAVFKSLLSIRAQIAQLSRDGLIHFSGFIGIFFFFMNIIPLGQFTGNPVLMLIYESLTYDKTLEDKMSKMNAALATVFLCFLLGFFYKLFL